MTAALERLRADWSFPTAIRFGAGRVREVGEACRSSGMVRPLLVTDPGLADQPVVGRVQEALREAGLQVAVFSAIRSNPTLAHVEAGVAAFRQGGHDGVVAVGGGSALDTGKAVAFMVAQTRPIWDFEDVGDWWKRARVEGIAPIVAVPTTAGTGSEVGRAAVVTDESRHAKKIIFHPRMLAAVVISDPELLAGLPPRLTAATGMDALAHNLEAFCATGHHPLADGIALEGMRLGHLWLARAVADGADLEARAHTLAAAHMGAIAFQKGLGAIHALSHPLGAVLDTHHGETNGTVMPYVLAFNREAVAERIGAAARYLGLARADFDGFLERVLSLRAEIGIPHTVRELGMGEEHLDRLAGMAAADPTAASNPRRAGVAEMRELYQAALAGRVER